MFLSRNMNIGTYTLSSTIECKKHLFQCLEVAIVASTYALAHKGLRSSKSTTIAKCNQENISELLALPYVSNW